MCVCVCLSVHICQISIAFLQLYYSSHGIWSYVCVVYMYKCVCVCVCVYVCKGGVYFNIVSQESISSDFIPSPPPCFSFYLCPVFPFRPLSTGEQGSFVLAEYGVAVCDIPMSGNVTDVGHFHGFYCT